MSEYYPEPDELEEPEEESDQPKRRRIRREKPWPAMLEEIESRVNSRKRLTLAQGLRLSERYHNAHSFHLATMPGHNRMVDELREAKQTIARLERRIAELESKEETTK